jgi:hypothetical protein
MPADLKRIPGADVKRRRPGRPRPRDEVAPLPTRPAAAVVWGARSTLRRARRRVIVRKRSIPWSELALGAVCCALGLYVLNAFWTATRVQVTVEGLTEGSSFTTAALADSTVRFTVDPSKRLGRATLRLDGREVPDKAVRIEQPSVAWKPGELSEGRHRIQLSVPRPMLGDARFAWEFSVDDQPPRLDVPALLPAVGLCDPVTVEGRVERGAKLTLDGKPLSHQGSFTLRYSRPPNRPLHMVAVDAAGNRTEREVIVPARYPGGQGVHVTAAAWGYEPLRRGILDLIDARLISTVQLDLKDEAGIVGYDSKVPLALQAEAVQPEYRLKDAVAELERRGVRVIGRIVAFRDPTLTEWAWNNDKRDWVVQTAEGTKLDAYGGFTNIAHPEIHRYNLDIALEAADAGVHDILWDYVRRPEGDPATMVFPGMQGSPSDAVVGFLARTRAALRERCVFQGAAVFGIAADRPDAVGQDIPRIAREVEYVSPMLYPSHWVPGEYRVNHPNKQPFDIVKAALADFQVKMAGTGTQLMPWLQDFTLGHPYGPPEVRAQIDASAELGVPDWLLWNPGATYTAAALDSALVRVRP